LPSGSNAWPACAARWDDDVPYVSIDQATKLYGATRALDEVCLDIEVGEFVTLLGPSGCGKSTTLRAVAGLLAIDRGSIAIDGRDVTNVPIHRRDIGMVFQNDALFPHMTVAENVGFGLRMRKVPQGERAQRTADVLALVHLPDFGARYPHQLSGGQQQRVAIARALVINPRVLLLDEPFAALDRKLREEMQMELRELTRRVGITSVFVTHDQEEALTLSDRIVVMNAGRIEQIGMPDAIYSRPETRFVADFMGARNILETTVVRIGESDVTLAWHGRALRAPLLAHHWLSADRPAAVALRPELIRIVRDPAAGENAASGRVVSKVDQGAFVTFKVETGVAPEQTLVVRQTKVDQARGGACAVGDTIGLVWDAADLVLLRDAPRSTVAGHSTPPSGKPGRTA
jgi:spermidine/putrescine ABC transporter ATP-binding subunit